MLDIMLLYAATKEQKAQPLGMRLASGWLQLMLAAAHHSARL